MRKNNWKQIRRTPYQALVALMVTFLTFFALSIFTLITAGSIKILQYFETAPQVIAFFEKGKDVPEGEIMKIRNALESTGKLADFKYVSIHEAEAIYKEKNKNDPLLLELVDYKILPPSIEISATSINDLTYLKDILEKQEGVEDIAFYEDIVKSLSSWTRNIKIFGSALITYLLLQSFLVIIIIIGMKVLSRKEEIEILKLIGANDWFVRQPFVFEGVFYGAAGAFCAWGLSYILLLYSTPLLVSWLREISLLPVSIWFMLVLLVGEVLVGMIVGFFASLLAVRRFLRK
jgi:cell division transport system permease protein